MHRLSGVALIGALLTSPAFAESDLLLVTQQSSSRGTQQMALDIHATSPFAGFEFEIEVSDASRVGTKRCVSELPRSLEAKCVVTPSGTVKAIVYLASLGEMPAGWYRVGYLDVAGTAALNVTSLVLADGAAVERSGSAAFSGCSKPAVRGVSSC